MIDASVLVVGGGAIGGVTAAKLTGAARRVLRGLGAVAGQTYAEVVANPAGKTVALRMWREGYEVGLAQGLHPGEVLGVEAAALAEGDVIDGAVVEKGRERGIPTPLHERVTELIHASERGESAPSPDALAELERL